PPLIQVSSTYTGASSEVVESAVTKPLEQAINGAEDMKYMTSTSGNDGNSVIKVTFDLDRDQDIAAVDVQNRISPVNGSLPEEVKKTGTTIKKTSNNIVVGYALFSDKGEYDNIFISNYIDKYISDPIKRIEGVGDVTIAGERKYAMRVWLDPRKLTARGLTASDVVSAIQEQNVQVPAGQIGQPPCPSDQKYQISIRVHSRFSDPDEFNNIVLKTNSDGTIVKVKDVGFSELGSENYATSLYFNKNVAVGILIYQLADANSLQVYDQVQEKMKELSESFPPGLKYQKAFDTTTFVEESINEVIFTLYLSIFLVLVVIFIFLQSWRTTLIPLITIPVSLIGTFIFIKAFGFSINTLTLFGLVLAIGLVVDDAIVVVENVERNMKEKGLSPFEAASLSMKEVSAAIVAATLVLGAVFIPVAASPGTTGQLYKQFALTIVFSVCISLFNALTLSPAMCALLLNSKHVEQQGILKKLDDFINFARDTYHSFLHKVLDHKGIMCIIYVCLIAGCVFLFKIIPTGFVPTEDQGYLMITAQAPEGSSLKYTSNVMLDYEKKIIDKFEEVDCVFSFSGFGFTGNGPNLGVIFVSLKPLEERKGKIHSSEVIAKKMNKMSAMIPGAIIVAFQPPAIQGIGNVGGFQFELIDKSGHTLEELAQASQQLIQEGNKSKVLTGLFTTFTANTPQLQVKVDKDKAKRLNVPLSNLYNTVQILLGSLYVNDFDYLDKVYRVYVQGEELFRNTPDVLREYYVNTIDNKMIPISNFITVTNQNTSNTISHYNLFRSAEINGSEATGYSSGQALNEMETLAKSSLPQGMDYEWSGIALEQKQAGVQSIIMFGLGILFVYLFLAAQYESLIDPLIIIMAVPLAMFGALLAQHTAGLTNDVYCQIGLVMLIGLACKNSILIVEFANQKMEEGYDALTAVLEAGEKRFRPIIMTSMAFILGVFPLVVASGAGAASRNSMGTAVFGGMIFATFISLLFVPTLYVLLKKLSRKKQHK
ncbi:MAG: efflux RND transporter permease subunit, partial [Vampirovibrionia bacterium]